MPSSDFKSGGRPVVGGGFDSHILPPNHFRATISALSSTAPSRLSWPRSGLMSTPCQQDSREFGQSGSFGRPVRAPSDGSNASTSAAASSACRAGPDSFGQRADQAYQVQRGPIRLTQQVEPRRGGGSACSHRIRPPGRGGRPGKARPPLRSPRRVELPHFAQHVAILVIGCHLPHHGRDVTAAPQWPQGPQGRLLYCPGPHEVRIIRPPERAYGRQEELGLGPAQVRTRHQHAPPIGTWMPFDPGDGA